jgi:hypothetical protein
MAAVALVGTLDTKGTDLAFLAGRLRAAGADVIVVDAGTGEPAGLTPDVDGETVAAAAGTSRADLRAAADRGRAVASPQPSGGLHFAGRRVIGSDLHMSSTFVRRHSKGDDSGSDVWRVWACFALLDGYGSDSFRSS